MGTFTSIKFILITIFFVSIIVFVFALKKVLFRKYEPYNISFYGCFSIKDSEYLTMDIDSESLNEKIEKINETISKTLSVYRGQLIKINNISIPKFIPILLGYKRLNGFIKNRVVSKNHLASLHFIRDINKQNISAIINHDGDSLTNSDPIYNAEKLINSLSSDSDLNYLKTIELSVKIYLFLFGQSLTDSLIENKRLNEVHSILDDTEKLITEIRNDILNISEKHKNSVEDFLNFWSSYAERYKAVLFIEQKQFRGAIKHIFKSIKLNPYFPYENYALLKQDFTKKYGIELAPILNEVNGILGINNETSANGKVQDVLKQQVKYLETPFTYSIINYILQKDNSTEIGKLLITELDKLDKNNPFVLLTKCEVIKHIQKGTEQVGDIYVDRFDECIKLLHETLKLDNEFPLINTKLGTMIMIKGFHFENQQLIDQGMEEYKKGMHFIYELGYKA